MSVYISLPPTQVGFLEAAPTALWPRSPLCVREASTCRSEQGRAERQGRGPEATRCPSCACREQWCHMTQEERDDSLRFNENITFGQLG